jgi:hypothetical protein
VKIGQKSVKRRSIAVQKRLKRPKMVKKTKHCHPVIFGWMKDGRKTEHCHPF